MEKVELKLVKKIIEVAEFIFRDESDIRCCLLADKHTSETERAIALACGLSFAGIKKLKSKGVITQFYVDDECLHIAFDKSIFESVASEHDMIRVED